MFQTSNSLWPCWHIHGTLYIHWFQKYHLPVFSRYWSSTVVVFYYIHVPFECFRMKKKIFNFVLHLAVWRMEAFLFNYTLKTAFLFILNLKYFWYRWLREINVCKILVDLWNLEHYGMFVSFWKKNCYDYAEILGALLSILFLWILTGVLFYMAVKRVIDQNYTINATIMLITAACGVAFNIM